MKRLKVALVIINYIGSNNLKITQISNKNYLSKKPFINLTIPICSSTYTCRQEKNSLIEEIFFLSVKLQISSQKFLIRAFFWGWNLLLIYILIRKYIEDVWSVSAENKIFFSRTFFLSIIVARKRTVVYGDQYITS